MLSCGKAKLMIKELKRLAAVSVTIKGRYCFAIGTKKKQKS
jgi:hypothetical protein